MMTEFTGEYYKHSNFRIYSDESDNNNKMNKMIRLLYRLLNLKSIS